MPLRASEEGIGQVSRCRGIDNFRKNATLDLARSCQIAWIQSVAGDDLGYGFQRSASDPSAARATTLLLFVRTGVGFGVSSVGAGARRALCGGVLVVENEGIKSDGSYPK
jgi:hypothetical protein